MEQGAWFKTATAAWKLSCERLEREGEGVVGILVAGYDSVAWPKSGKIDRMHGDSRALGLVCLTTANLPESLTVNPLFPTIMRRTKNMGLRPDLPQNPYIKTAWLRVMADHG